MGFVQDISELVRKGPELVSQANAFKINTKSIARGAKDSTFQFPMLIVDSAPIDMANTTARTFDQVYASFTQTWLSMNSMFDITVDPTPLSYLRRLHQNLRLESTYDSLLVPEDETASYMEKVYDGTYRLYLSKDKTSGVVFNVANRVTKELMESYQDELTEYMADFDLEPFEVLEADGQSIFQQASDKFDDVNRSIFGDNEQPPSNTMMGNSSDIASAVVRGQSERRRREDRESDLKVTNTQKAPQLLDRDVKRSNDMVPYAIQVRLLAVNDKKEFVQYVDFIVGVKAVLHPIKSDDMIDNIARALQNKSTLFKFLRWTTGEISLVKDLLLNLNDMKLDAVNQANGRSPFFNTLKRLKGRKLGIRNITVPHAMIPNATVVITTYEADFLENKYGIRIREEKTAAKLMNSLFLMAFVIMDEGTNTISVLYDGDQSFQTYSLETLERNNDMNSNKLGREIGRMIAR